ncbi:ribbon-helix-helix protein, CopG family [Methanobacterium sp. BAmetb5]|jgi:CopG family nickel-responsive transcriptional regulator|uniref:ribbon-helix-helix protein, CopG family n=1 Tax=Methanobacterium sp. BAmetb5 TaxID=2025351 RepID=UPI000E87D35A|nr:ribbon-helix-helix protein, CopG family [Methanobacterium sp. BAmetb5]AXV39125.1 MAG: nickel-responsive transcriptional regulator NikR [Methanobacterium sp. BAmetb5]
MMRISISLPKKLLKDFDDVVLDREYRSRSKGIRDALKDYIIRTHELNEIKGDQLGVLTVYYDFHYNGVLEDLKDIQQQFNQHIKTALQLDTGRSHCLDVIVVESDMEDIRNMMNKIQRLNGVEHVKLSTSSPVN